MKNLIGSGTKYIKCCKLNRVKVKKVRLEVPFYIISVNILKTLIHDFERWEKINFCHR